MSVCSQTCRQKLRNVPGLALRPVRAAFTGFGSLHPCQSADSCLGIDESVVLAAVPSNPDPAPDIDPALLDGFRAASAEVSFWASAGVMPGTLWPLRDRWKSTQSNGNINSDSMH